MVISTVPLITTYKPFVKKMPSLPAKLKLVAAVGVKTFKIGLLVVAAALS